MFTGLNIFMKKVICYHHKAIWTSEIGKTHCCKQEKYHVNPIANTVSTMKLYIFVYLCVARPFHLKAFNGTFNLVIVFYNRYEQAIHMLYHG